MEFYLCKIWQDKHPGFLDAALLLSYQNNYYKNNHVSYVMSAISPTYKADVL